MSIGTVSSHILQVFALPMALSQWTPVPIGSESLPTVDATNEGWSVKTEDSAGGFAYLLPAQGAQDRSPGKMKWQWQVSIFPKTEIKLPLEKVSDDYALRVGALLSNGKSGIGVPRPIRALLEERKVSVSYVVFYCAVPSLPGGSVCAVSPYNDRIVNCLVPAGPRSSEVSRRPVEDLIATLKLSGGDAERLRVIGAWVFADSDNSDSKSEAKLGPISILKE